MNAIFEFAILLISMELCLLLFQVTTISLAMQINCHQDYYAVYVSKAEECAPGTLLNVQNRNDLKPLFPFKENQGQ